MTRSALVAFYKPSIEISAGFNVVRRNTSVNSKSNALEVSALYGGDTAAGVLVYNNVFYRPSNFDFHLAVGSLLIGAGMQVNDPDWDAESAGQISVLSGPARW